MEQQEQHRYGTAGYTGALGWGPGGHAEGLDFLSRRKAVGAQIPGLELQLCHTLPTVCG